VLQRRLPALPVHRMGKVDVAHLGHVRHAWHHANVEIVPEGQLQDSGGMAHSCASEHGSECDGRPRKFETLHHLEHSARQGPKHGGPHLLVASIASGPWT